jgi:hypothetical protein
VNQKSQEYQDKDTAIARGPAAALLTTEALPAAAAHAAEPPPKGEDRSPLFWRVCGGAVLSIAALVALNAYQQLSHGIAEVRRDVSHVNEARGELVKKEELNGRVSSLWSGIKELQANGAGLTSVREKVAAQEQQFKSAEEERKELAREVQRLRERLAKLEARQGRGGPMPGASD